MTGGSKTHFWGFKLQGFQFYIYTEWCRGQEENFENIFSKWVPLVGMRIRDYVPKQYNIYIPLKPWNTHNDNKNVYAPTCEIVNIYEVLEMAIVQ